MSALKFRGTVLPEGEPRDPYVVDGGVTYEPQASAELVAEGWIVPGLVDAHCHIGLDSEGAVPEDEQEKQALTDRDAGTLLIRDCGSAADTSWIHDRDDLPRLIRAGRHLARTRRYIRNYAHEIEPEQLPDYVAQEAERGDGWVKLVGDWIEREAGDLAPSWTRESLEQAMKVAHERGARVTAHVFGEHALPDLIHAGIDCIEHGTGLDTDLIDTMVANGVALVPTVKQLENFPGYADAGGRSSRSTPSTCGRSTPAGGRRSWPPTGRCLHLRRDRRRGSAPARADRRRGPHARRLRVPARGRAGGGVVAGPRVAGPGRLAGRGDAGGLRGLRPQPA
jgi:hypothetical protein